MSRAIEEWFDVANLYADYTAHLDSGRYDQWPLLFTQDGHYRVVARENYDRIALTPDGPRFAQRVCVYDTDLIPNSLIYPI